MVTWVGFAIRRSWEHLRARRERRWEYIELYSLMQRCQLEASKPPSESAGEADEFSRLNKLEQAILGDIHPALIAFSRRCGASASFQKRMRLWGSRTAEQYQPQIRELEKDMDVADIHLYRKIATKNILEEEMLRKSTHPHPVFPNLLPLFPDPAH